MEEAATSNDYWEDFYFTVDTFEHRCYYNVGHFRSGDYIDGNASESDFSDDTFEDRCTLTSTTFEVCHCTDGHQEDIHCLNQLAKECSRHRVKHPLLSLARGLVWVEIKANYKPLSSLRRLRGRMRKAPQSTR